jgi:hypothetical protein
MMVERGCFCSGGRSAAVRRIGLSRFSGDCGERAPSFCDTHTTVLDCANGYQKENQEEVNKIEEE